LERATSRQSGSGPSPCDRYVVGSELELAAAATAVVPSDAASAPAVPVRAMNDRRVMSGAAGSVFVFNSSPSDSWRAQSYGQRPRRAWDIRRNRSRPLVGAEEAELSSRAEPPRAPGAG
jgi:hypothetical protein